MYHIWHHISQLKAGGHLPESLYGSHGKVSSGNEVRGDFLTACPQKRSRIDVPKQQKYLKTLRKKSQPCARARACRICIVKVIFFSFRKTTGPQSILLEKCFYFNFDICAMYKSICFITILSNN